MERDKSFFDLYNDFLLWWGSYCPTYEGAIAIAMYREEKNLSDDEIKEIRLQLAEDRRWWGFDYVNPK